MNTIYLVRHGENKANITKEFSYKKVNYPLTPKGVIQAQQTAEYFLDKHIDAIYTSPLKRTRETAQIIGQALGLEPIVKEQFREVNVGSLEGMPPTKENWRLHNTILMSWFAGKPETFFPEGENLLMLRARMLDGLRQVVQEQPDKNVIIVGHGGIFSATIKDICPDFDLNLLRTQEYHNCAVSSFELETLEEQMTGRLKHWASHKHMRNEAAELVSGFIRTE